MVLELTGGVDGLFSKLATNGRSFTHPRAGTSIGGNSVFGDWVGIIFGLAFFQSFSYWTTSTSPRCSGRCRPRTSTPRG
jgi:hypothetical protein